MVGLIKTAQEVVREVEGDVSCVSLRDVGRCLRLRKWFSKMILKKQGKQNGVVTTVREKRGIAELLSLAHVYYFRLSGTNTRTLLLTRLCTWLERFISKKRQAMTKARDHPNTNDLKRIHIWIVLKHLSDSWFDALGSRSHVQKTTKETCAV